MMSIQNPYNLLNRTYEVGLAEVSIREQVGCLAYSPLASGYLTGKYRNKNFPKGSRMQRDWDFWTRYRKPNTEGAVEEYFNISKKYGLDFTKMSLKFCEIQDFKGPISYEKVSSLFGGRVLPMRLQCKAGQATVRTRCSSYSCSCSPAPPSLLSSRHRLVL